MSKRKHSESNGDDRYHPNAPQTAEFGIVLREFYPPEMSNKRCDDYNKGLLERPIDSWQKAYQETSQQRAAINPNAAVVHWFKSDLRLHDNRALHMAYKVAKEHNIPLIGLYILSPQDLTAHLSSAERVDFTLRTLEQLKRDLGELDIPLYMETQSKRNKIPSRIVELCHEWGANNLFANLEYEVDELRREAKLLHRCAENGIKFETAHDTCVVTPGLLSSQQGKQYAVYSPWFRAWLAFLDRNPEFRKTLKRNNRRLARAVKEEEEAQGAQQRESIKKALQKAKEEGFPADLEEKESYFMGQVAKGEGLVAEGADKIESALAFYKALKVYPQPKDLISIYDKTVPKEVLEVLAEMVAMDPALKLGSFTGQGGSADHHGVE